MKQRANALLLAAAIALISHPAVAASCTQRIVGESRVHQALTGAHDGATASKIEAAYTRAFAVARTQAINAWRAKVRATCPGRSTLWLRATRTKIEECDRAMGGRFTVCASAIPAKKLF